MNKAENEKKTKNREKLFLNLKKSKCNNDDRNYRHSGQMTAA